MRGTATDEWVSESAARRACVRSAADRTPWNLTVRGKVSAWHICCRKRAAFILLCNGVFRCSLFWHRKNQYSVLTTSVTLKMKSTLLSSYRGRSSVEAPPPLYHHHRRVVYTQHRRRNRQRSGRDWHASTRLDNFMCANIVCAAALPGRSKDKWSWEKLSKSHELGRRHCAHKTSCHQNL